MNRADRPRRAFFGKKYPTVIRPQNHKPTGKSNTGNAWRNLTNRTGNGRNATGTLTQKIANATNPTKSTSTT